MHRKKRIRTKRYNQCSHFDYKSSINTRAKLCCHRRGRREKREDGDINEAGVNFRGIGEGELEARGTAGGIYGGINGTVGAADGGS